MYNYPPNSKDFKRGYAMGIEKGRAMERKLALALVLGFVLVFEVAHWALGLAQRCG
jgi:hypothetical protein